MLISLPAGRNGPLLYRQLEPRGLISRRLLPGERLPASRD
jgi:hypothetical protein